MFELSRSGIRSTSDQRSTCYTNPNCTLGSPHTPRSDHNIWFARSTKHKIIPHKRKSNSIKNKEATMTKIIIHLSRLAVAVFGLLAVSDGSSFASAASCKSNCLRGMIQRIVVNTALVTVVDENGGYVQAAITGEWTFPDGRKMTQTLSNGGTRRRAEFKVTPDQPGTYNFEVTNIAKAGWTFDPQGSISLTGSLTISAPTMSAPSPAPVEAPVCVAKGDSCASNKDCCSGRCRRRRKTCR